MHTLESFIANYDSETRRRQDEINNFTPQEKAANPRHYMHLKTLLEEHIHDRTDLINTVRSLLALPTGQLRPRPRPSPTR